MQVIGLVGINLKKKKTDLKPYIVSCNTESHQQKILLILIVLDFVQTRTQIELSAKRW